MLNPIVIFSQSTYCEGFALGFKKGFCHNNVGCIAPPAPCGVQSIGGDGSYNHGYNDGFAKGQIESKNTQNSNFNSNLPGFNIQKENVNTDLKFEPYIKPQTNNEIKEMLQKDLNNINQSSYQFKRTSDEYFENKRTEERARVLKELKEAKELYDLNILSKTEYDSLIKPLKRKLFEKHEEVIYWKSLRYAYENTDSPKHKARYLKKLNILHAKYGLPLIVDESKSENDDFNKKINTDIIISNEKYLSDDDIIGYKTGPFGKFKTGNKVIFNLGGKLYKATVYEKSSFTEVKVYKIFEKNNGKWEESPKPEVGTIAKSIPTRYISYLKVTP